MRSFRTAGRELVRWTGNRGMGQYSGDFVSALASAIQQVEGYYPGSLAYRNNNPGNLRPGSLAVGATGQSGGYATFPDYQTGWNALLGLIQSPMYWNLTLTQFFAQYAPSADNNNPAAYAATVAANLGVDANTPISTLAAGGTSASIGPMPQTDTSGTSDSSDYADTDDSGSFTATLEGAAADVSPVVWAALGAVLLAAIVRRFDL